MSYSTLNPVTKIDRHLKLLGYGGTNLHKQIQLWDDSNGSEWVVNRLKTLKQQFIHLIANLPFDKEWIAYRNGFPKGPFGQLFKLGLRKPKICLSVLNSYMVYKSPSDEKIKDVFQNISRHMTQEELRFCDSEFFTIGRSLNKFKDMTYIFDNLTIDRIKPSLSTSLNTHKPFIKMGEQQWIESLKYTSRRNLPTHSISCHFYDKNTYDYEEYGGELHILPEKGNKARVIALPHAELQIFLKPLHDALKGCLSLLKEDCTDDQIKGAMFAQEALKDKKTVHSVDLSSATDRFPLPLQLAVLRAVNKGHDNLNWASIFERTVKLKWKTIHGDINYGAGQPMGLYGSFSLFALTHHAIVQKIKKQFSIKEDCYRILGDDIVITNDTVALNYKDYMKSLGVTISISKTISSDKVAEFAGFLITKDHLLKAAKPIDKGLTVDNMINYIQTLGYNPFKSKLKDLGDLLCYLPTPYGAGLNPRGLTYNQRLNFYRSEDLVEKLKSVRSNIESHLFAKVREEHYWNPYTKSYVDYGVPGTDVILKYFCDVASEVRSELQKQVPYGDSRMKREHLLNNVDSESSLAYVGSLGQEHRKVQPTKYISDSIAWYQKLFSFYPWKNLINRLKSKD